MEQYFSLREKKMHYTLHIKMTIHTVSQTQLGVWEAVLRPNTEDKGSSIHTQRFYDRKWKNNVR